MSQLSSRARVELAKAALSRIGLESPELRPYQDEPAQMPSGTVGKDGYLRLEFADRGDRSVMAFMDRRVPFLVQRALYWDEAMPQMPCIFIILVYPFCIYMAYTRISSFCFFFWPACHFHTFKSLL